ncbi:MAG: hypothetical protein IJ190_00080 [Prevotella sp.]|nr:hypothetical protein [Prevotella sp.]
MRRILLILFSVLCIQASAQESKDKGVSPLSASLELTSKYMWRGIEYGTSPVIFPSVNFSKGGINVFALGGYATNGSHQEVDLGVGYTYKTIFVGLADYYYPSAVGEKDGYFRWSGRETGHYIEAYTTITPERFPVWLTASTYIFGADKKNNGKNAYSSYVELGYHYDFNNDNKLNLILGVALNKSFYTNYEKGFSVVNMALKYSTMFKLGSFRLPVSASYIVNPYKEKSYVSLSVYLNS